MRIPAVPSVKLISPLVLLLALAFCPCVSAQFNPVQAAKGAWNKAKQQQQQGQRPASQPASAPANTSGQPSSAQPANSGAQPAPSSTSTGDSGQGAGAPWAPPSDTPAAAAAPAGPLDPAKLQDVVGIHLGMAREDVPRILSKLHPDGSTTPEGPDTVAGLFFRVDGKGVPASGDYIHVEFTLPPGKQRVYFIERYIQYQQAMTYDNFLTAVRQKYGKEIFVDTNGGNMYWLFDEQGRPIPPDQNAAHRSPYPSPYGCDADDASGKMWFLSQVRSYTHGGLPPTTFCDSLIALRIQAGPGPVDRIHTWLEDRALLRHEVTAAGEAAKAEGQRQQQQQMKNAQQAKPNL